ncbi:MAG: hypothetical protein V1750_00105 [Acidobacteriota bacterium]
MQRADLLAFAQRDRFAVEALRTAHWCDWHRIAGPLAALVLADQLRLHAISLHPAWPSEHDRDEDLAAHQRLLEMFRRVRTSAAR